MDEEERNYICLTLLLSRVGSPCLRRYFKNQWNAAGKYIAWTDCAQNGADLLRIFKPLPYEKDAVTSGDTSQWEMSLLVKALLHSRPPLVVAANLVTALQTLRGIRNQLHHSPNIRVEATDFQTSWREGCDALRLFGATAGDFDKVKQDVQKPWSELPPMFKHFADQSQAILDKLDLHDTIPSEIRARGPEALKAYEEALESGKTKNRRLLVMVVGAARAGKTSLLKSLNGEEFDPKEDSTDGIQLQRTFCKSQENCWSKESDKGISYADCMADIIHKNLQGGDDSEEIHDKNFALNAIKVESEEMNEEANEERENQEYISEKSTANLPKPIEEKLIKLMGSKMSDKTNRENEVYIKSLDFAGQAVYNVIHPIFLTSKAVFILVYNLKNIPHHLMKSIVEEDGAERELVDPFEMTNMENLELWLSCISSYTDTQRMAKIGELSLPPVFLAGTHADRFDGNLEAAKKIIREIYKSLSPSKNPSGSHVVRNKIYTVNNSISGNGEINDESVRKLKADIEELSKSLPHVNEDIPINWLWFEEKLSNLVENENKKYITIDEALKIANECKVNTSAESKEFLTLLNYLHDSKTVIYFEETKKVFIDTEWLVKVFTKVIEVRPVEKRDGFDESWDKLEEKGVLDRALVEHVWKGLVDERNTIDALLLIMEKFSLICRWNTSEGEEVYLVPCMLCNSKKREDIAKCLEHEKSSTMVIRFNISHVSLGIFPRLFVAIAEKEKKIWPNLQQPILHKNICRIFEIGKERNLDICIIQSSFQTISVTVCNIQNIDGQRVTEFCQVFRKLLDQIFDEMWRNFPWMQNMTFEYGILCPVCTTSPNKCKSHEIEGCTRDTCIHFVNEEELSVDTPKCKKYVTNLDNVIEEKAYAYWFPRQVVGPTLDLTENQKRWSVIGICLNIVLLPPLRKFLGPNILNHYTNLKASHNIHKQVHKKKLVNDVGRKLNYININNNGTIEEEKDYDYKVTSTVDLAKLYLQPHMAEFTGFNDTCDLYAVLRVLSSASVFSADIRNFSSKVRKDVRNEWGHYNFQTWDETKFGNSFNLMHSLLKALKLSSEDENTVADQLKEWKKKCEEICMANTVPAELVKDIEDKVSQLSGEFQLAQLSKDVEHSASSQEEEVRRVLETLQALGPTSDLTKNQKRWLVIGICLNIVLLPPLRKFLGPNMLKHYTKLKTSYNIHKQVHGGQLVNDVGRELKYHSINNNDTIKKEKDYDYKVTSAVDLAKLYLKSHMAQFTGFNDTCDLSAVLGVLSSASVFSADIQDFSSKVQEDVRNEWAHPNFQSWDKKKFANSFNLMHSLLKALKLSSEDENTVADQLKEWENNCVEICMANTVPPELVKDIEDKVSQLSREFQLALHRNKEIVAQLSEDVKHLTISQQEEVCRVLETLVTVQDAVQSLKQRMGLVEVDVGKVKEEVRKVKEDMEKVKEDMEKVKEDMEKVKEEVKKDHELQK